MAKFSKIEQWDNTHKVIFFNPVEVEREGEKVVEYQDKVIVAEVGKGPIVEALVRRSFSVSDEIALLRQRNSKKAEFNAYDTFVEDAKATADAILAAEEV